MQDDGRGLKVIVTGATGLVGEGVLRACLADGAVERVLAVGRRPSGLTHPKLSECIAPDFTALDGVESRLRGYDACFYCAGISSSGMTEADYTRVTYDTALAFANTLLRLAPDMVFVHVSGSHADATEKGRVMWARVKGRAENAISKLGFRHVYHFRPGFMRPIDGQKNVKGYYRALGALYPVVRVVFPGNVSTMEQVARAMIHAVQRGYPKAVLEVTDINALADA